ncbi:hypothetical protein HPP92_007211 [Vanilla planifolia]|uniref:Aquaporin TIP5-1 n=1 Tax=Vanilla planifolia TaxID=51239 RepID=A0A835RH42_VANPL|nr:hypothetical protein HPP92_007211 [Vanilla planifolia]
MASTARSQLQLCFSPSALRSYLAEFISTFFFVFVAVGSSISARMLTPDVASDASSLVATAVAQGFALSGAIYIAVDVSGGHVNPAVTFSLVLAGHLTAPVAMLYWASQLLGSTFACLLLWFTSAGQAIPTSRIATEMTGFGGTILESVMTFALVYTVYVAVVPRHPGHGNCWSLTVGLVAGACVMAAGSLTGASMNPARSFGPALVTGDFKNHAVYWIGPLMGAALAAVFHQSIAHPQRPSSPSQEPTV